MASHLRTLAASELAGVVGGMFGFTDFAQPTSSAGNPTPNTGLFASLPADAILRWPATPAAPMASPMPVFAPQPPTVSLTNNIKVVVTLPTAAAGAAQPAVAAHKAK